MNANERDMPDPGNPPAAGTSDPASSKSQLRVVPKLNAKLFESCIFCEMTIYPGIVIYFVNKCTHCPMYPLHKRCQVAYLKSGKADGKTVLKGSLTEAFVVSDTADQARGKRCGRGRHGTSIGAFPECPGIIEDIWLSPENWR